MKEKRATAVKHALNSTWNIAHSFITVALQLNESQVHGVSNVTQRVSMQNKVFNLHYCVQ